MLSILFVAKERASLVTFAGELAGNEKTNVSWVTSGREALEEISKTKIDAVVAAEELADGTALSFVKELVKKQPLINCAMVSSLSPDDFHEVTEGLGVFMQLPAAPAAGDAEKMIKLLKSINSLMSV